MRLLMDTLAWAPLLTDTARQPESRNGKSWAVLLAMAIYPGQKLKRRDKACVSNAAAKTSLCYEAESSILFGNERVIMPYKETWNKDHLEFIYLNRVLPFCCFSINPPSFTASLMPTQGTEAWQKQSESRRVGRQTLLAKNLLMILIVLRPYLDGRHCRKKGHKATKRSSLASTWTTMRLCNRHARPVVGSIMIYHKFTTET